MTGDYHHWRSPRLGQEFELKSWGRRGRPLLAFPSMGGRFFDFENFGMIEACRPFMEEGRLQVFSIDGRDNESWLNEGARIEERGRRHEAWDACVVEEVMPFIRDRAGCGPRDPLLTGCSGGAFHAANFFFRHPDLAGGFIGLSGIYGLDHFAPLGDYCDEHVYFNDPLRYLPGLADAWYLDRFRSGRIILCAGQGPWEHVCLPQTRRLSEVLDAKGVPHWLDIWGRDVSHEWVWWRRQLAYFLGHVLQ